MNRINLTNFGKLPILAKQLWTIPKYTCNYKNENFYKKNLIFENQNISIKCMFLKKNILTEKFECNKNIFSSLEINSNNYLIEENCNYSYNIKNNYLDIEYLIKHWELENDKLLLKDKLDLSLNLKNNKEINSDFHISLLPKTQELLKDIKKMIEKNRDNIKIIF
jgi:hypothetical protein